MALRGRKSLAALVLFLIAAGNYAIIHHADTKAAFAPDHGAQRVLIIDPGHGGADGGALAADGTVESGINLDIALRLRELCRFLGVECVMTREKEELDYPAQAESIAEKKRWDTRSRVEMICGVENGFLLSIHQNQYPDPRPRGPQVFHNGEPLAEAAAERWQRDLNEKLLPQSRRVSARIDKRVYIMNHVQCPAVLVECGFLSNAEDLAELKTEAYRTKLAAILISDYLQLWEDAL